MNKKALIVGATSSLAYAICNEIASEDYDLILCGRDKDELELLAGDLKIRHNISVEVITADLLESSFNAQALVKKSGDCEIAVILTGNMGSNDFDDIDNITNTTLINYIKPAAIMSELAKSMDDGVIVCISSVAGDRGRKSNYIYGSAKAALTSFCSGLRNRYADGNVHIMTVKPGFIDTPMTYEMNSPLIASREKVAQDIIRAMHKRKDIVYVPFFWRYIMLIIQNIPERIFKKLSL